MNYPKTAPARVSTTLASVLLLLTVFGPISMDLYLPALPELTQNLGATTSVAQLTITACLVGLAAGQVIAGPLSDRFGRRTPLIIGVSLYVLTSLWCAVSPAMSSLIMARLGQGLAGAVGLVIAQAAGRDLYEGPALLRYFGRLTVLAGLAAIVGPLLGGVLSRFTSWRGLFVLLAALGLLILIAVIVVVRETLPRERRISGTRGTALTNFRRLVADPTYRAALIITGLANAAVFAYLSGATFVLQTTYGLSPQQYALAFGLNSLGFMTFGFIAGRLTEQWSILGTLTVGTIMLIAGALGMLLAGLTTMPLTWVMGSLFVLVSGVAVTTPPTTTLALRDYPDMAGTASSGLGLTRFALGAAVAPLVGLGGQANILPLGLVLVGVTAAAGVTLVFYYGRQHNHAVPIAAQR